MDDIEREAIRAEGGDPDDPDAQNALELVRLELGLLGVQLGLGAPLFDAP